MYRIRFHGRGGQGIKTAGRVLGSALFLSGFEVQDAPRYGAERRGAALLCTVRAALHPILERGVISRPDLVVVVDDTLIGLPGAGVTMGLRTDTAVLVTSHRSQEECRARLQAPGPVLVLSPGDERVRSSQAAGAAARVIGVVSREALAAAVDAETHEFDAADRSKSRDGALRAYDELEAWAGLVREGLSEIVPSGSPDWVDLAQEPIGGPAVVEAARNSVETRTGLWRSLRPVLRENACHRCVWICGTVCPDSAIDVALSGLPRIDLDHCKGCMICVAECPSHAIDAVAECSFAARAPEPASEGAS